MTTTTMMLMLSSFVGWRWTIKSIARYWMKKSLATNSGSKSLNEAGNNCSPSFEWISWDFPLARHAGDEANNSKFTILCRSLSFVYFALIDLHHCCLIPATDERCWRLFISLAFTASPFEELNKEISFQLTVLRASCRVWHRATTCQRPFPSKLYLPEEFLATRTLDSLVYLGVNPQLDYPTPPHLLTTRVWFEFCNWNQMREIFY